MSRDWDVGPPDPGDGEGPANRANVERTVTKPSTTNTAHNSSPQRRCTPELRRRCTPETRREVFRRGALDALSRIDRWLEADEPATREILQALTVAYQAASGDDWDADD